MKKKRVLRNKMLFVSVFCIAIITGCKKEIVEIRHLVPILTTSASSNITQTTALSGGNITSDGGIPLRDMNGTVGGTPITERGVCWNTKADPTILNSKKTSGTGTGIFSSSITGLTAGTAYYARAYATNSAGTAYGNQINFTTLAVTLSVINTLPISGVTSTTATGGGTITADGGGPITARGVCWSTTANPTTGNSKTTDGNGTGTFASSLTGLTAGTVYNVRAYATNSAGTAYGQQVSFATATLPTLTTTAVSNIAQTSATGGGNISSDGGASVTARGICWNTSPNPTTANNKIIIGSGTGAFSGSMTGLTAGTTYYLRAYATNLVGTAYGNEISFTTITLPTITTTAASSITFTTAASGGNITSDGGSTVSARGVCWSTSQNPTVALATKTVNGTGTGAFVSNITGLTSNTTYYVRAYATNAAGTTYGSQITLKTALPSVGQPYQGGVIAYILVSGDPGYVAGQIHGFVAATTDQSTGIRWYNGSYVTTGATGTALGTGSANTTKIITVQGNTGSYAAKICRDYNGGGYSDWYLPSSNELNKLLINRTAIGGFYTYPYWTSSELNINYARDQSFPDGNQNSNLKTATWHVRAIRTF